MARGYGRAYDRVSRIAVHVGNGAVRPVYSGEFQLQRGCFRYALRDVRRASSGKCHRARTVNTFSTPNGMTFASHEQLGASFVAIGNAESGDMTCNRSTDHLIVSIPISF